MERLSVLPVMNLSLCQAGGRGLHASFARFRTLRLRIPLDVFPFLRRSEAFKMALRLCALGQSCSQMVNFFPTNEAFA